MAAISLREQLLARVQAVLAADAAVLAAGVQLVSRSREVSITRAKSPAIVVMPDNGETTRLAMPVDKNQLVFAIEIFVRGDPWDSLADPVDVAAHAALMADAQLPTIVSDVRRIGEAFESQEADRTAGTLTVRYRATYLTQAGRIDLAA
jgi:hypothetical protein